MHSTTPLWRVGPQPTWPSVLQVELVPAVVVVREMTVLVTVVEAVIVVRVWVVLVMMVGTVTVVAAGK
ncbi:MAG: hypothetical protein ACLQEQ_03995 [Nitrososphaerales archaeon]